MTYLAREYSYRGQSYGPGWVQDVPQAVARIAKDDQPPVEEEEGPEDSADVPEINEQPPRTPFDT
jgi:hypothetical protein